MSHVPMIRQEMAPLSSDGVSARLLLGFPDLVEQLAGNPQSLFEAAGIATQVATQGGAIIPYRKLVDLLETAAAQLACPDFGLRLAEQQASKSLFGHLGELMRNSRNLGEAFQAVASHSYAHSPVVGIWLKRSRSDRTAMVGHDILLDRLPVKSQAMEMILLSGHLASLELTDGWARPRRVLFRHQPLSSLATYRRYFGCEVRFGQLADGIIYLDRDLKCPVTSPDAAAYQAAIAFIEARYADKATPLHAKVRGIITHFLTTERCTKERVAEEVRLHPRTLHRQLAAAGTSFQLIKDEVRRDLMLYYLWQTRIEFTQISEKLGFSEQSVMNRFCQKWFACSPGQLRSERPY